MNSSLLRSKILPAFSKASTIRAFSSTQSNTIPKPQPLPTQPSVDKKSSAVTNLTPFFVFVQKHREAIQTQHPNAPRAEIVQIAKQQFSALPESEKQKYRKVSRLLQMKQAEKDKTSPFGLFLKDNLLQIKKNMPEASTEVILKEATRQYRELTPEQKKVYFDRSLSINDAQRVKDSSQKAQVFSAFAEFVKERLGDSIRSSPGVPVKDVLNTLPVKFKELSPQDRKKYEDMAAKSDEKEKKMHHNQKLAAAQLRKSVIQPTELYLSEQVVLRTQKGESTDKAALIELLKTYSSLSVETKQEYIRKARELTVQLQAQQALFEAQHLQRDQAQSKPDSNESQNQSQ